MVSTFEKTRVDGKMIVVTKTIHDEMTLPIFLSPDGKKAHGATNRVAKRSDVITTHDEKKWVENKNRVARKWGAKLIHGEKRQVVR